MKPIKMPQWPLTLVAVMGGGGLFVVTFLDSSVLSFPFVTDLLVIRLSIQRPARMPYYAAMASIGSLAGCVWLYLLAKKGGEIYFERHRGKGMNLAKRWVQKRKFLSVFIPSILPPPLPFKVFVLAEGVFQIPIRTFVLAILLGRGLRFFGEGILAVRYGTAATRFVIANSGRVSAGILIVLAVLYAVTHWVLHRSEQSES